MQQMLLKMHYRTLFKRRQRLHWSYRQLDRLSTVGDRAFPVAALRIWNSLPLHVTSAPSLQTFRRRGWSRFCSASVSRPNFLFLITDATLFSA